MMDEYPNQKFGDKTPVPRDISDKYSSRRYGLCPRCKHKDEICLDCVSVQNPIIRAFGLFSETMMYHHSKFERVEE